MSWLRLLALAFVFAIGWAPWAVAETSGCWRCCPGSGHTSDGHCGQICSGCDPPDLQLRKVLRKSDKCSDEYRRFLCTYSSFSNATCKWVCVDSNKKK
jgi:hypothetical protein